MSVRILSILFFVLCCSCAQVTEPIRIEGPVDQITKEQFDNIPQGRDTIIFNSLGGKPSSALEISEIIVEREISLIVDFLCASACIEYIVPAAQSASTRAVKFINEPIIAFHWNAALIEDIVREYFGSDIDHCPYSDTDELRTHQEKSNVNHLFWKETKEKLGANNSKYQLNSEGCPIIKLDFENSFWLPTSHTLKNTFGLKFKGKVCSDNLEACKLKIDENWIEGTRVVVGDEVYISKGKTNP